MSLPNASPTPPPPLEPLLGEMRKVLVGQDPLLERLAIALLAGGHVLLEGVPGVAKTLAARALAKCVGCQFGRIQFTADLLPADLVGTEVYQPKEGSLLLRQGPIFTQVLLADEINRAPARVQSALLEAMQERRVTIGHQTLNLPTPFFVLATQNPIEQEGTYPLPEAQLDRFLMKVTIPYPSRAEERLILDRHAVDLSLSDDPTDGVQAVVDASQILAMRGEAAKVFLEPNLRDYVVDLVRATRPIGSPIGRWIELGASPRATIALTVAAKARAYLEGRDYVVPHDIKVIAPDVLRHRLLLTYEAQAEGRSADDLIRELLAEQKVP